MNTSEEINKLNEIADYYKSVVNVLYSGNENSIGYKSHQERIKWLENYIKQINAH